MIGIPSMQGIRLISYYGVSYYGVRIWEVTRTMKNISNENK